MATQEDFDFLDQVLNLPLVLQPCNNIQTLSTLNTSFLFFGLWEAPGNVGIQFPHVRRSDLVSESHILTSSFYGEMRLGSAHSKLEDQVSFPEMALRLRLKDRPCFCYRILVALKQFELI